MVEEWMRVRVIISGFAVGALAATVFLLAQVRHAPAPFTDTRLSALATPGSPGAAPIAIDRDLADHLGLTASGVSLDASHLTLRRQNAGITRAISRLANDKGYLLAFSSGAESREYWADRHLALVAAVRKPNGRSWISIPTPASTVGLKRELAFWNKASGKLKRLQGPGSGAPGKPGSTETRPPG
jgi:hypothetical protein